MNKDAITIILAIATAVLSVRSFMLSRQKDFRRESAEMAEIKFMLTQLGDQLREMQKDLRGFSADFKALSERVVVLETRLNGALEKIEKMENKRHE